MPYINLIQEQRLSARQNEAKARGFFFGMVTILGLSVVGYGFFSVQGALIGGQIAEVERRNQKNAPLERQIDETKKQVQDLTPRLKTLSDAQGITDRWNRILDHLTRQTPKDTWLTAVKCIAGDVTKPITVSFSGLATAQAPVGEFILRLQNEPAIENVQLRYTSAKLTAAATAIEFQIDADLVGSAEQKAKVESSEEKK